MFGLVLKKHLVEAMNANASLEAKIIALEAEIEDVREDRELFLRGNAHQSIAISIYRQNATARDPDTGRMLSKEKSREFYNRAIDKVIADYDRIMVNAK